MTPLLLFYQFYSPKMSFSNVWPVTYDTFDTPVQTKKSHFVSVLPFQLLSLHFVNSESTTTLSSQIASLLSNISPDSWF